MKIVYLLVFHCFLLLVAGLPVFASTGLFMDMESGFADSGSSWFMEAMQIPEAHQVSQGQGAVVALIDSGVDITHPALRDCIDTELSYNTADDSFDLTDYLGHGTMMAGILCGTCDPSRDFCGVAPRARVIVYKVSSGSGYTFQDYDLAEAIRLAADSPAVIINLSLVIDYSTAVEDAVNYALSLGKVVVAAAGNDGGLVEFPASIDGVVSVGAVDTEFQPVVGSGSGPYLVLSAPGYNIGTTISGGQFGATTGTSAAAALVSGVFALVNSLDPMLPALIAKPLAAQSSLDEGWPGFDAQYGFGVVHALNTITGTNPLQADPDRDLGVYLGGQEWVYRPTERIRLDLILSGIGGQEADMWIQETDPRGQRFYFVFGENRIFDQPWPYNRNLGSPYLFPGGETLSYSLFGSEGDFLLSDGIIHPEAPSGLYEMVVGVQRGDEFVHSRVVLSIAR